MNGTCRDICREGTISCTPRIRKYCPSLFEFPAQPINWGDIHFFYSWNRTSTERFIPDYVCYNEQICGSLSSLPPIYVTLISENSTVLACQPADLFPFTPKLRWDEQLNVLRNIVRFRCSTSADEKRNSCSEPTQFRCGKKCLSKHRLVDYIPDCVDHSDENFNSSCSLNQKHRKTCTPKDISTSTKYGVHCVLPTFANLIGGGSKCAEQRQPFHFSIICDGFVEYEKIINGQRETDEMHCNEWQCDNQYTRCDGIWNCRNGADDAQCSHPVCKNIIGHPCLLPNASELICLPLSRTDDGKFDCLGGTDERYTCRTEYGDYEYRCWNNHSDNKALTYE
jgi:hypothetical protein